MALSILSRQKLGVVLTELAAHVRFSNLPETEIVAVLKFMARSIQVDIDCDKAGRTKESLKAGISELDGYLGKLEQVLHEDKPSLAKALEGEGS